MSRRYLAALASIITLGACDQPAAEQSPELRALDDQFEEAFNTGDFDALAALLAEDVRLLPAGFELREGHEVVAETFREFMEEHGARGAKMRWDPIEAMVAGDIGYVVGTYSREGLDGEDLERGKYVDTWRRFDGEWKITNHMLNADRPPGLTIPTVIVTHEVENAERWLEAWGGPDGRHDLFARHGATVVRIFRSSQNPDLTGLMVAVDDMEAFRAFIDSPEAEAARTEDAVVEATLRVFTEVPEPRAATTSRRRSTPAHFWARNRSGQRPPGRPACSCAIGRPAPARHSPSKTVRGPRTRDPRDSTLLRRQVP